MERRLISGISFPGRAGRLRGLWQYLTARSQARADVEKARITLQRDRERDQRGLVTSPLFPTMSPGAMEPGRLTQLKLDLAVISLNPNKLGQGEHRVAKWPCVSACTVAG